MLDGFLGYNQFLVHPKDQQNTTFTTPWGTFMCFKMHSGLMNEGTTFQRAIDISFYEEKYRFLVFYLNDISIFSKSDDDHLKHLKQVFQKCRFYGVS